jgi:hypothetical protein
MQFTSVTKVNSVYWLTSIPSNEAGVTRRILEDLEPFWAVSTLGLVAVDIESAEHFFEVLDEIAVRSKSGLRPLIHLDLHGSTEHGLQISATAENIAWDKLADKLRTINIATTNNLIVVSGACFSFQAIKQLSIQKAVPFFALFAPETEITAGIIEKGTVGFYKAIFCGEDIFEAAAEWFGKSLSVFHSEKMLAVVLARHLNDTGLGKQRKRRMEYLVTTALERGIPNNQSNLQKLRKSAKAMTGPTAELIERFIPIFLCGRRPNFTIAQIAELVVKARKDGYRSNGPYAN